MKAPYVKPTSKLGRVREWCLSNHGENVSTRDLMTKFDLTHRAVHNIIIKLRAEGLLHDEVVYLVTKPTKMRVPA